METNPDQDQNLDIDSYLDSYLGQISEDAQGKNLKFNIPEEQILVLQSLVLKTKEFEKNIKLRINDNPFTFKIVDNNECNLDVNGETLLKCEWELIGMYKKVSDNKYSWIWSWALIPDEKNNAIKKCSDMLPESCSALRSSATKFEDPMVVSYLLAYITYNLNYDNVYINYDADKIYSAFGLKNLSWRKPVDPKLLELYNTEEETKEEETKEEETKEEETKEEETKNYLDIIRKILADSLVKENETEIKDEK